MQKFRSHEGSGFRRSFHGALRLRHCGMKDR